MAWRTEETDVAIRLILICTLLSLAALSVAAKGDRSAPITARAPIAVPN